jgi:TetR/AcrR family transcriptional regulator
MRAEERRELILDAATLVFGDHGYAGATTALIARAAGVSQPYVVRVFGTKERLFLEVLTRSLGLLLGAFRVALAEQTDLPVARRIGLAYAGLAARRGMLPSLMHALVLGGDPAIGPVARDGFTVVYRFCGRRRGSPPSNRRTCCPVACWSLR